MSKPIRREIVIPHPPDKVWRALTTREALAEWMYPNDFEPQVGHHFVFRVPPDPSRGFEGLTVRCEVLACDPPHRLEFSWTVGGPVVDTRVSFRLEPAGSGTRLVFNHDGFDATQPYADQAIKGANMGWAQMLKRLPAVVARV